jgi:hypothetical protein
VPAVVAAAQHSIKTDVGPLDAIALAAALVRDPGQPDHMVIDTSLAAETTGDDGAYLLLATPQLKPAVARFLGGPTSASVEVLNGAGVAGLASRTADRLTQNGFVVTSVGDANRQQPQTTIQTTPAARAAAERLANLLHVPTSRISENAASGSADIRLVLGPDAQ